MRLISSFSIPLTSLLCLTNALHLKIEGRHRNFLDEIALSRRGNLNGTSPLNNSADISYYANINLNGDTFSVLIDTGSADLWVAGTVPGAKSTGKQAGVEYAVGKVQGPIKTAEVTFASFKVPNQAYLEIRPDDENKQGTGLVGLGPHDNSNIYSTLKTNAGVPLLDSIFMQNTSTPNYLAIQLGRLEDPSDAFPGDISIGETLPELSAVTSQPKLPVTIVPLRKKGNQHFQILLDADGIIGPDNKSVVFTSAVSGTKNPKQATALVDTGFSLTQVPPTVAEDFYGRLTGAQLVNISSVGGPAWIVPCNQEVNLTFAIGGQRYPIHPLDATLDPKILNISPIQNSNGDNCCIGMFQPFSFKVTNDPTYDIILGMSFLRNAYTLFNFGDFVAGSNGTKRGNPYIQMLSTTEPSEAHSDFVQVRLEGVDTTDGQTLGPGKQRNSTPGNNTKSNRALYLGLAIAAGSLAVLLLIFACFYRRRRNGNVSKPGGSLGAYSRLSVPAPDMRDQSTPFNPQQLYDAPQQANQAPAPYQNQDNPYPNPWDARR
ncbi:aspartic peptidase a1 [Moniliophthora roreri MCA 2997]|uniref:Aspartic peptidase a1 n=2 Tax=Moniliophthora roreri TaxID=221103 RepID=V2XCF8_MONRO|nr:aspartic peptidase a1 [Moniliophthora roreri MCA 2997]KAI3618153.1 aspartic peptidase a1 [Moniliophthora roreri]